MDQSEKWSNLMKKVLNVIIPILLVLVILASIVWYCFIYDQTFTRDMMLSNARFFSGNGNQAIASWFYDMAYKFCSQDDDVAIELAEQYKSEGNYTKAEYTLSSAIADGGGAELYVALSKTYVAQNKLLDAVTMLDNISNPEIKAQLDAVRPLAPTADPAAGFYSQYITVNLTADEGTVYYTLDGEYPSIDDIPYSESITLPGGETIIYAVNVGDNGMVSPLTIIGYTVTGVIEEVTFEDASIEAAVREQLNLGDSDVIYTDHLWSITSFTVPENATTLADLSGMVYLETLTAKNLNIDSMVFLAGMTNLTELDLSGSRFPASELNAIGSLPQLQSLNLQDCGLSTIAGLENNLSLTKLNLANNTIRNLEPLTGLVNLTELDLQHNAVTFLTNLSGLAVLEKLNLSYNAIEEVSALSSCSALTWLDVSHNQVKNLKGLNRISGLTYLSASSNQLSDVAIIAECTGLKELYIANNSIDNITALETLTKMEIFDFAYNNVAKLPKLPTSCALRIIDGSYNNLTGLSALKNMQSLSHVYMDYNQISSIASLEGCTNLMYISVYGVAVTGVKTLTQHGVIVNYNPNAEAATATEAAATE